MIMRYLIGLLFIVGIIVLQVFLSKKERIWPGLVMPALLFCFSLLYPLNMVVPADGATVGFAGQMILVWLIGNIPTAVLLAIYFACRGKLRRNSSLEKMNIKDLG